MGRIMRDFPEYAPIPDSIDLSRPFKETGKTVKMPEEKGYPADTDDYWKGYSGKGAELRRLRFSDMPGESHRRISGKEQYSDVYSLYV